MKDALGREISIGDKIAYARMSGQSAIVGIAWVIAVNDVKVVVDGAQPKIRIQPVDKNWRGESRKSSWLGRPAAVVVVEPATNIQWGLYAESHAHGDAWRTDSECTECVPESIKLAREAIQCKTE